MEKQLTRDELLFSLLRKAKNPFTTMEQKNDIKRILMESTTMRGMNHLFLVKCYFEDKPLFNVNKEEAIKQASMAYKENNTGAFFYLYRLTKDTHPSLARNYLRLACMYGNPYAYLELANLKKEGVLFEKNIKESFENYKLAAECNLKEGYFGMLLIASMEENEDLQKEIYQKAKKNNIELPGIVK